MSVKVLYLSSCHGTLEYDDVTIMDKLGIDWFSTGIYLNPKTPLPHEHLNIRKPIDKTSDPKLLRQFNKLNPNFERGYRGLEVPIPKLNKEFVDQFDVVVVVMISSMINNWNFIKHKPIILKTCGNTYDKELMLKQYADQSSITFVRGSPTELSIRNCNGGKVIRIPCDENLYKDWKGNGDAILSFHSHFKARRQFAPIQNFLKLQSHFNFKIYGSYAAGHKDPLVLGTLPWSKQIEEYKHCPVYFTISSGRAPITYNFLEAFMTGAPVVTFGPKIGGSISIMNNEPIIYDISNIIEHGVEGFWSDSVEELKDYIRQLLSNRTLAEQISANGRKKAISLHSIPVVCAGWRKLYKSLGFSL